MRVAKYVLIPAVHKYRECKTKEMAFDHQFEYAENGIEMLVCKVITPKKKQEVAVDPNQMPMELNQNVP